MNYDKYIISFCPGSSGRFVTALLDSLILRKNHYIDLCPYNSAHNHGFYRGVNLIDPNHPCVYHDLSFDSRSSEPIHSNILHTHVFPDFELINLINSRFSDIGIIIIKVDLSDLREVFFNSAYKNHNRIPEFDDNKIAGFKNYWKKFINDETNVIAYPKNCLILPYSSIYEKTENGFLVLEFLSNFTAIKEIPISTIDACYRYSDTRNRLIKEYSLR